MSLGPFRSCIDKHALPFLLSFLIVFSSTAIHSQSETEANDQAEVHDSSTHQLEENPASFLTLLGLVQGHLLAGVLLYADDLPALAATHMKHPSDELYEELTVYFGEFDCPPFATELSNLASAVTGLETLSSVREKYSLVFKAIERCEQRAGADDPIIIEQTIIALLENAHMEFRIGVNEIGEVVDKHEYQDAWGFSQVAQYLARKEVFQASLNEDERTELKELFRSLEPLWPSLNEDQLENFDLSVLETFLANRSER